MQHPAEIEKALDEFCAEHNMAKDEALTRILSDYFISIGKIPFKDEDEHGN